MQPRLPLLPAVERQREPGTVGRFVAEADAQSERRVESSVAFAPHRGTRVAKCSVYHGRVSTESAAAQRWLQFRPFMLIKSHRGANVGATSVARLEGEMMALWLFAAGANQVWWSGRICGPFLKKAGGAAAWRPATWDMRELANGGLLVDGGRAAYARNRHSAPRIA